MEFQTEVQSLLGRELKEEKLKSCMANFVEKDKLIGYKETKFCDPRYTALLNYARDYLPDDSDVKVHKDNFIINVHNFK